MTWEYETIKISVGFGGVDLLELQNLLNRKGSDHWELVSTFDTTVMGASREVVLIFKRPK
jgi:hypothetical protein